MRKYFLYLVVFILLLLSAWFFFYSNSSGNLNIRNSNFSIENIDRIKEIRLSDKNNVIKLQKVENQWMVNNKFQVKEQIINNFLMAINRLQVQYPVSKTEKAQIALLLKNEGIRVVIRKKWIGSNQFLVSKPAMSKGKTYMMMNNSSEPFVVMIPGFKGNVSELFSIDENIWRNKMIFNYLPQNISVINVRYPVNPEKSFTLKNYNDGSFELINYINQPEPNFKVENVAKYFTYFQNIQFENVISDWSPEKKDSVLTGTSFIQITVKDLNNIENNIKIFRKPSDGGQDEFGDKSIYDLNKAYAVLNNNNELLLIQYYIFDPILKEIDYFR